MNKITFVRVVQGGSWGYWDVFEGTNTEVPCGRYLVKWEDGRVSVEDVMIEEGTMHYTDMGHDGIGRDSYAYFVKIINGNSIEIKLRGFMVYPVAPCREP